MDSRLVLANPNKPALPQQYLSFAKRTVGNRLLKRSQMGSIRGGLGWGKGLRSNSNNFANLNELELLHCSDNDRNIIAATVLFGGID